MEEGESVPVLSRKELRKQKLMEYLAAKGKMKLFNLKPDLSEDCQGGKPMTSALKVVTGKENRTPADSFRYNGPKGQTLTAPPRQDPARKAFGVANNTKCYNGPKGQTLTAPPRQDPSRKAFGVANNVNIKGSILTKQQNATCPSSTVHPARPKLNLNPAFTRTYSVVSSKSNPNAASHLKKQPNKAVQTSGKALSNAAPIVGAKSNSRFCWSSTVSTGTGLGPAVKTKTGLLPAATQPRNTKTKLTQTSSTVVDTTTATGLVPKKVRSSSTPSVSLSQTSAIGVPSTARAVKKVQDQNKLNSKALLGKHSQPSTSTSFKCKAAPPKPEGRVTTNKSVDQPAHRSTKPRSGAERQKNEQPCKVAFQMSSRPANGCSSRAINGVTRTVVSELGRKTKTSKETNSKREDSSANARPPQADRKRTGAPVMSQTVPQPTRTVNLTGQATGMKTPKVPVRVIPQTEGKKLSAAQEERLRKLQEWREAKGISYKRPPMPVKPQVRRTVSMPQPFWASMKEEDEAHSLIYAVDRSLADCIKLLGEGCPPDQVEEVLSRLPPVSQKFAKYWICRARLMEQEGNLDVLPMFEEAVRVVLEPVDELRTVVFEILKKRDEIQAPGQKEKGQGRVGTAENTPEYCNNPMMTPKPVRALICGERGHSSVVKYKITATPGGPPSQQREPPRVNGQEVRFFTPVRRSVRIERASLRYPVSLQDHDLCVASYNDLMSEEDKESSEEQAGAETSPSVNGTPMYVYRENEALKDKVFVHLVCDDAV